MGYTPIGTMSVLAPVSKPSTKADTAHPLLVWMPVRQCRNERLLDQDIEVSENISRAIPGWFFPTGFSARYRGRPDTVFVHSIPDRPSHIDPTKLSPQDRDIHLVKMKLCPDTNPFPTLKAATPQHATTITRLKPAARETQTETTR
eukprot:1136960-Pelagomonas_calceolata.AAC.2